MKRTGPSDVEVLPCASAAVPAAALASARSRSYASVTSRVVQPVDDRVGVEARGGAERVPDQLVVVEQERRREVRELQGAQDAPFAAGLQQTSSHDRPAAAARRGLALFRHEAERHPVTLPEGRVPVQAARRVVRPRRLLAHLLAQPDHHEPPGQLVAEAPLEHPHCRARRVRPRAHRVRVERDLDRRHSGDRSPTVRARAEGALLPSHLPGRARWGVSGSLNPKSAPCGTERRPRDGSSGLGLRTRR